MSGNGTVSGTAAYRGCGDGEYIFALHCLATSPIIDAHMSVVDPSQADGAMATAVVRFESSHYEFPAEFRYDEMSGGVQPWFQIDDPAAFFVSLKASASVVLEVGDISIEIGLAGAYGAIEAMRPGCGTPDYSPTGPSESEIAAADETVPDTAGSPVLAEASPPMPPLAASGGMPDAAETALWERFANSGETIDAKAYLSYYPNGFFAQLAHVIIDDRLSQRREERNFSDPRDPRNFRLIEAILSEKTGSGPTQTYKIQILNYTEHLYDTGEVALFLIENGTLRYQSRDFWLNYGEFEGRQLDIELTAALDQTVTSVCIEYSDKATGKLMFEYSEFEWDPWQYMRFLDGSPANGYYRRVSYGTPEAASAPNPCAAFYQ